MRINPVALQSKKWLSESLLELMDSKQFSLITIKEIAEKAQLDRKTFYRHFNSKEEALSWSMEEMYQKYHENLKNLEQLNTYTVSETYFSLCIEYLPMLRLLHKSGLLNMILTQFNKYLSELNDVFSQHPEYRKKSNYELFYQSGGFWNVTLLWIENGATESAQELAEIVSSIMPKLSK